MNFEIETRKLTSSSGYIQCIESGVIYTSPMYLGICVSPNNYIEASEEEYNIYIQQQEELAKEEVTEM